MQDLLTIKLIMRVCFRILYCLPLYRYRASAIMYFVATCKRPVGPLLLNKLNRLNRCVIN